MKRQISQEHWKEFEARGLLKAVKLRANRVEEEEAQTRKCQAGALPEPRSSWIGASRVVKCIYRLSF